MEKSIVAVYPVEPRQRTSQVEGHRAVIPNGEYERFSPILRLSEDWFSRPDGYEMHPHRGIQTVSLVLDGALEHRDHAGGHGVLGPGDVQWMTAGRGVMHSEMPHGAGTVHMLQLWLNLPAAAKMRPPRYVNQRLDATPEIRDDGVAIRVYAGRAGGVDHPHGSEWPLMLLDLRIDAGRRLAQAVPASHRGFLYLLEGRACIGATDTEVAAGHTAWFEPGDGATDEDDLLTIAAVEDLWTLLVAGPPIDEPVVAHGPFVMNTVEEVRQAYADYAAGRFVEAPDRG